MTTTAYGTGRNTVGITEYIIKYINDLNIGNTQLVDAGATVAAGWVTLANDNTKNHFRGDEAQWPNECYKIRIEDTEEAGSLSVYHIVGVTLCGIEATVNIESGNCVSACTWGSHITPLHDPIIDADLPVNWYARISNDGLPDCIGITEDWDVTIPTLWALCIRPAFQPGEIQAFGAEYCIGLIPDLTESLTPSRALSILLDQCQPPSSLLRNELPDVVGDSFAWLKGRI